MARRMRKLIAPSALGINPLERSALMQPSDYRRFFQGAALAASIAIGSAALPSVASAQGDAATANQTTRTRDADDNGTDWGWLGLLGLAGLLGLRRRDNHVHHTDTTTRRP
jgi:MYXO-CTERM domain-containing protein